MNANTLKELYNTWIWYVKEIIRYEVLGWNKKYPKTFQTILETEKLTYQAYNIALKNAA